MAGTVFVLGFLALIALGLPIAYAMGVMTMGALFVLDIPLGTLVTRGVSGINSFSLLAVPLFMLAGEVMTAGGLSQRLIAFADSLVGWMRGGLGIVNVTASLLFGGISGSIAADTVAVGGVMIPAMTKAGYDRGFSAAVTAHSADIGALIPPSVILIIYGGITGVSVGALFLAGVFPGLLLTCVLVAVAWWEGRRQVGSSGAFSLSRIGRSMIKAFWALLLPLFLVLGILQGVVTATEAGVVAVAYAFVVALVLYREVTSRDIGGMFVRSAILTSVLMLLIAMASGFAWILAYLRVPSQLLNALTTLSDNPQVILGLIIVALLIVGMVINTVPAAIIVVPVLEPIGTALGYDPVHFALVIIMALLIGTVTPPVGIVLFITASMAEVSLGRAARACGPFLVAEVSCIFLVAFFPPLVTWLPSIGLE
jgi:C4-dicarboxylate transporter DctM subunit